MNMTTMFLTPSYDPTLLHKASVNNMFESLLATVEGHHTPQMRDILL